MNGLITDPTEITKKIDLKVNWNQIQFTNCYAFALGLDVCESSICDYAYQPGVIGRKIKNIPICEIKQLSIHERMLCDMDALKIDVTEISEEEQLTNLVDYIEWKIAIIYYRDKRNKLNLYHNWHFLRQSSTGIWYHKNGYRGNVNNLDFTNNVISNVSKANFDSYELYKCYKLSVKRQ